jgi:signal transduction histidine kinase
MRRVIENLVTNALKYGAADQPITISLDKTPDGVRLTVHNEGNPIPSERQAELFTLFRRLEPMKNEGWGLGLVLVKGIIEAHGGKVYIESSKERGTSFVLELPQHAEGSLAA